MNNKKRILGLDLGEKTLGVSISDENKIISMPLKVFRFEKEKYEEPLNFVVDYCKNNNIEKVVLGLPKHMSGEEGIRANISKDFKAKLEELDVDVVLIDERYTSKIANKSLLEGNFSRKKRKNKIDKIAAQIILQSYLDTKRKDD